jgi:uncharacterized protein (DUF433 family)
VDVEKGVSPVIQINPLTSGMYEPAEAARLLDMQPNMLRRWIFGYSAVRNGVKTEHPPVVDRSQATHDASISFVELVELWFVKRFLEEKISFQQIRDVYRKVREETGQEHPFATDGQWITLGRKIIKRHAEDRLSHDPLSDQYWFDELVRDAGVQLDFPESGLAQRWFPAGKEKRVVVDPRIAFGRPTVVGHGITTFNVWDLYQAEGHDRAIVRDWFGLGDQEVMDAVAWEEQLRATKRAA